MKKNDIYSLPYKLEDTYILQFGTFHFYEAFVVAEIQENISFDKEMAQMLISLIDNHYGKVEEIGYISNRIKNYSVSTSAWYKFFEMRYRFKGYAVVSQKKSNIFTCAIRKLIYKSEECTYDNLLDAASWLTSLHVLKKNKKDFKKELELNSLKNKNYFL